MVRYLARRCLHAFLLLAAVSVATFLLLNLAPGDYFDEARLNPSIAPQTIQALRHAHGLDAAIAVRYARWARAALTGDFGTSVAYGMPAARLLLPRCRNTLLLTTVTLLVTWCLALPLGVWSASIRRGWLDRLSSLAGTSMLAVPDVILAPLLLLAAARSGWLSLGGILLPVVALTAGAFPILLRHVRATMLEVLGEPFVLAARGFGVPRQRLLFHHILPAAANPLISLLGLSAGSLLSSSLLIEVLFGWPGLGPLFLEAVGAHDAPLVLGVVLLSASLLAIANLLADLLLYAADPRIRRTS
ncbi:MAG: ABC transporter permease [Bryobacteraceae bacterium]